MRAATYDGNLFFKYRGRFDPATCKTVCKTQNSYEKARGLGWPRYFPLRRNKLELVTLAFDGERTKCLPTAGGIG